ncbi:uncharacterized protein LOC126902923 isoform X2 [Daktulosphaira vitifoliae]|nr:uncharacterized protein LOC126902923 isoform X2 [Daktulosphaira vitifoliae]XP_050536610.1 uncharacterized protein LOC126902923 isoform X2 [Daktulosphaira vitifoliae]
MNGRSKGLIMKSNSFACLHQQVAYEELCADDQPIYNNVPYEDEDLLDNYESFSVGNGRGYIRTDSKSISNSSKRHSGESTTGDDSSLGSSRCTLSKSVSLSSRSTSDSSESSKSEVIFVSANAVKYSASKYGVLLKRDKILFVDHTKKYWAAVLASTMYVYHGEKELKPCQVIHLEGYTARDANVGSITNKKDCVLELVCPGKKTYQFITQNSKDMISWVEAINNSSSKLSISESLIQSSSPIFFKHEQVLLPNRQLPNPPTESALETQDFCYDKPNPIIRPVHLYANSNSVDEVDMDSIYQFIDESKHSGPKISLDNNQSINGSYTQNDLCNDKDDSYYNVPNNKPVECDVVEQEQNNNIYDEYYTEKEICYDIVTRECEVAPDPVLGVQEIIQKIEGINNKKQISPLLRRKSPPKGNNIVRNSTCANELYEPNKIMKNMSTNLIITQAYRQSR